MYALLIERITRDVEQRNLATSFAVATGSVKADAVEWIDLDADIDRFDRSLPEPPEELELTTEESDLRIALGLSLGR